MTSIDRFASIAATIRVAITTAMAVCLAAPALAGPLVIRASGPSATAFKLGQRLADTQSLVLRSGDRITVLDARGTRSFTGPGNFRFDQPGSTATPTAFAELLTQKTDRRARIGAVRGIAVQPDGKPVPPGLWLVDSGSSERVCVLDPSRLALWRADPSVAETLPVRGAGSTANVSFEAEQSIAAWPRELAGTGEFRIGGSTITVQKLTPAPASLDGLAAALLAKGCTSQVDRLALLTAVTDAR